MGDGRAEASPAIGDGGQVISLTPDIDGTGSGSGSLLYSILSTFLKNDSMMSAS